MRANTNAEQQPKHELLLLNDAQFCEQWPPIAQDRAALLRVPKIVREACAERARALAPWVADSVAAKGKARPAKAPPQVDAAQLVRADTIVPKQIFWVWPGYLARGKLSIIAGAPGTGKTTIHNSIAAIVSRGATLPDGSKALRGNVLIWTGEDDLADTLVPRLLAAGADMRWIHFITGTFENGERYGFDPARDIGLLTIRAGEIGDISLLIIDPIVAAVAGDSHKNSETRRGLQPIVDLASVLDCAVLGVSHYSKGTQGRDPVERVTGSLAFGAVARVVLGTAKPQAGGKRRLVRAKSNIGPDGGGFEYELRQIPVPGHEKLFASCVEWCGAIEGEARDLLADAERENEEPANEATGWLRTLLTEEADGLEKREIMKAARREGHAERTLQRAREKLGVLVHQSGFGKEKRSIWKLPSVPNSQ